MESNIVVFSILCHRYAAFILDFHLILPYFHRYAAIIKVHSTGSMVAKVQRVEEEPRSGGTTCLY